MVVMDINMSKMDGIMATRLIKTQHPQIVFSELSIDTKGYQVYAMQKAGAFDVLKKDSSVGDLYEALQRAVAAVQPVLILEEMPSPKQTSGDSQQADNPTPSEPLSLKESNEPKTPSSRSKVFSVEETLVMRRLPPIYAASFST